MIPVMRKLLYKLLNQPKGTATISFLLISTAFAVEVHEGR